MSIEVAAVTDVGRLRAVNQDAVSAATFRSRPDHPADRACLIVTDGLGGHAGGEVASGLAVETVAAATQPDGAGGAIETGGVAGAAALRTALEAAHDRIRDRAAATPALAGMGSVIVVAWLAQEAGEGRGELLLAHAGDSRAYRLANGVLERLTTDHSWVSEGVRDGRLSEAEARVDPRRNVVTRSLGAGATVDVELSGPLTIARGDRILLCSDGLHGVVTDEAIAALLGRGAPAQAARALIDAANEAGGPDNIGVAIAEIA